MTVYVLANCYQAMPDLDRMWQSVRAHLPQSELIVVDGKYPDFPSMLDISTDDTRTYARTHGLLITCIDYECEKRTAGLRFIDTLASEGDWVLYLDADEVITSFFGWPKRVGYFSFTRAHAPVTYGRCRLYKWQPGLEFRNRHYDLYSGDELVSSLEDAPDFQPVGTGVHYEKRPRPKEKTDYYRRLRQRERSPWEVARAR